VRVTGPRERGLERRDRHIPGDDLQQVEATGLHRNQREQQDAGEVT
jgi:hypothetical protein